MAGSSAALSAPGAELSRTGQLVTSSGPTVGTISLPGTQPIGVVFYAGGNKLFVADETSGNLLMIDAATRQVVNSVFVGHDVFSSEMALDETAGKIYVGSDGSIGMNGTGLISVVNANTGALIKTINPAPEHLSGWGYPAGYFRLAADSVHGKVYVSFYCADCTNTLGVIDTATDTFTPFLKDTDVSPTFVFGFGVQGVNTVTNEAFAVSATNLYVIHGGDLSWSSSALPHGQPLSFAVNEPQNKLYFWFNGGPYPSGVVVLDRTTGKDKVLEGEGDKEPLVFNNSSDTLFSGAQVDTEGIIVNGATDAVTHVDFGTEGGMGAGDVRASTNNAYFASDEKTFVVYGSTKHAQTLATVHQPQGGIFSSSVAIDQQRGLVYVVNDDHDGVISVIQDGTPTTTTTTKPPSQACVVPKVRGKTLAAAKKMINKAKCSLGKVTRKYHAKIKKGCVISQAPAPGKRLAKGGKVNLVVSRGKRGH
ncbi:MAG: PASTA domain-containing protein [Gaiellaceae bacterium]